MTIHVIAYVLIPILIYLCFRDIKTVAYAYILCAPLQTVTVFNISGKNIMFYHLIFLILLIKYVIRVIKQRRIIINLPCVFMTFLLWCLITIPFSIFNTDEVVLKVSGGYDNVAFSFQQITQYAYLVMNFAVCIILSELLADKVIDMPGIKKVINAGYIIVMVLAIMQLFVPAEICTMLYRNSTYAIYTKYLRLSGPFPEPSMLALYSTPLFCIYLCNVFYHQKLRYIPHILLFLFILFENKASSAIVGIAIGIVIFVVAAIYQFLICKDVKKFDRSKTCILIGFTIVMVIFLIVVFGEEIIAVLRTLEYKLAGNGVSGSQRTYALKHHLKIFTRHFIAGVGYGTLRSFDLLSTLLCSVGIVGFLMYIMPVLRACFKLFIKRENRCVMLYVLIYNAIMLVSVNEFAFPYVWIGYAIMFYLLSETGEQKRHIIKF